jgi:hypothetical protein
MATPSSWAEAEEELTKAIEIRDRVGDRGFLLYEFNRAYCRIRLDRPREESLSDLKGCMSAGADLRGTRLLSAGSPRLFRSCPEPAS